MKKLFVISVVLMTLFLAACQTDVPPEPGAPSIAGKADYNTMFAEPDNFEVRYDPLYFNTNDLLETQYTYSSAQYIWHTGYYLSEDGSQWVPFEFDGNMVGGKWMTEYAKSHIEYETKLIDANKPGVVLAYSCNNINNAWDCHGNKWMLLTFDFEYQLCVDGDRRCIGDVAEVCDDNIWHTVRVCEGLEVCEYGECVLDLPEDPGEPGDFTEVEDVVKIETENNMFNLYDMMGDVLDVTLTENELPGLLQLGVFDDNEGDNTGEFEYVQTLKLSNQNGEFRFIEPFYDGPHDREVDYYVSLLDNNKVYRYELLFNGPVYFNPNTVSEDFVGNELYIQDKMYTIVDADAPSGLLGQLVLVAGDSTVWLVQDQPYTIGGNTVTVIDVDNTETKCGVNVNNVTKWIDEGTVEQFGDLNVGVLDVIAVEAPPNYDQDTCELSLGSAEIVLEDGDEVIINGVEIRGSMVEIAKGPNVWEGLIIEYTMPDDMYLSTAEAWTDPVFGRWSILFDSMNNDLNTNNEEISLNLRIDEAELRFLNNKGKEVIIPYYWDGNAVRLGADAQTIFLQMGEVHNLQPEGTLLLYIGNNGEAHVLSIADFSCTPGTTTGYIDISDETYDNYVADNEEIYCDGRISEISLGALGVLELALTESSVNYVQPGAGWQIETVHGGRISLSQNSFEFIELEGAEQPVHPIRFVMDYDDSDSQIEITSFSFEGLPIVPIYQYDETDVDYWGMTHKGTLAYYVRENGAAILHNGEETTANAYVKSLASTIEQPILPERCQFPAGMDCIDKAAICPGTDMVKITLRNNIGFEIEVEDALFNYYCDEVALPTNNVANNEVFHIHALCRDIKPGDDLDFEVKVIYTNQETGLTHSAVGQVRGRADNDDGNCALPADYCTDTDGGVNIYVAGYASTPRRGQYDYCNFYSSPKGVLYEGFCQDGFPQVVNAQCPAGQPYCNKGACSNVTPECTDTDGGIEFFEQGTVFEPRFADDYPFTDYCQILGTKYYPVHNCTGDNCGLREFYCNNPYPTMAYEDTGCPGGCVNGACLPVNEKGFRYMYAQCYDGEETNQGGPTSCKPSSVWSTYAQDFCEGHCSNQTDPYKCGVSSFSVKEECGSAQECTTNMDCPQINCIQAPCPSYVCVDGQCVFEETRYDLADYPSPFIYKSNLNGKIVVGAAASTSDVLAAIDIAAGLNEIVNETSAFTRGIAILDSEVTDLTADNYIVVGMPCVNTVATELLGNPENCAEGFEMGKAKLKLFTAGDKTHLLVAGYSDMDTRGAALVLNNYEDFYLQGEECEVTVASLNELTVNCI